MYFMNKLLLTLALTNSCPETEVVNKTSSWTSQDEKNLALAKNRCKYHYPNSPCLKKFIKKETRTYSIICAGNK